MAVKVGELKLNEVRKRIAVTFEDNRVEEIIVYNPLGEERKKFIDLMNDYANKVDEKSTQELTKEILKKLTNLKVYKKDDIEEIINNPRGEFLMVLKEINEIRTELEYEFLTYKLMEVNQATIELMSVQIMEKAKHLSDLSQELEAGKVTIEDVELDVSDEGVKKDGEIV